jgi:TetR/AcrR family transcriptional regulator, transcriptional repressor for nem operon
VSIDDVMKHAGLTRGGFYKHLSGKDELYAEAEVSRIFASWNQLDGWLRQVDGLRGAA